MLTIGILITVYLSGASLGYWMMQTEHEAEKQELTKGDKVIAIVMSLLSLVVVIVMLSKAWFKEIGRTGHWDKPAVDKTKKVTPE